MHLMVLIILDNMKKTVLALLLFFSIFSVPTAFAQDVTTEGTEFWVSFIGNGFKDRYDSYGMYIDFTWLRTQLIISAKRPSECTITNPNSNYEETFQVQANVPYTIDVPIEEAYMELEEHGMILGKGLYISATDTVSVYCANIAEMSFDASYILPIQALANDYIIQTYDQSSADFPYANCHSSAFVIIATEDGETIVDITPSVNTLDGRLANQEYSVTLYKGETYQVRSHVSTGSRDLSGTRVTARDCKKIAVFNGNNLTKVPNSGGDSDCVFEQAMPLKAWGKSFVVTSSLGRQNNDYVKITSAFDDNEISINGQPRFTLNTGQSRTLSMDEIGYHSTSCFIAASRSCAVYMYNQSKDPSYYFNDGNGAPSMVWIAPIEQRIKEITFSTFNYESEHDTDIENHFVNIIVKSEDVGNVTLDGNPLQSNEFEAVTGTDEYKFYRQLINHGNHHLTCPNGFNAHIYGYSNARGYAYMAGSKAADLSTTLIIDDEEVHEGDTVFNCSLDPIVFVAEVNYSNYDLTWDFGDNTSSNEETVQHSYGENGFYSVTLTVQTAETDCNESTQQTKSFYIDARREDDDEYSDHACIGKPYTGHGFVDVPVEGDTILIRQKDSDLPPNCRGQVIVHITAHQSGYNGPYYEETCFDDIGVFEKHGITIHYSRPGTYDTIAVFPSDFGCESFTELHLTVNEIITDERTLSDSCDSATIDWFGETIKFQRDCDTLLTGETPEGCFWERTIHVSGMKYTPVPMISSDDPFVDAPHYPISATEFNVNRYTYSLKDKIDDSLSVNNFSTWLTEQCEWTISKQSWRLIPSDDNLSCTVYAMDWTEDTIWLCFKAVNPCADSVVAKYWLKPSFYDVDEHESHRPDIEVLPNPNDGQMQLCFENMTGLVDVKVYDMRGNLVDQFEIFNDGCESSSKYSLEYASSGIYFLVATSREGTLTKKVVIAK